MSLGYLGLVGLFVALLLACFAAALAELWRPRDPGPLSIDVGRDVQDRYFGRVMRRAQALPRDIMPGVATFASHPSLVVDGDGCVEPGATVASFVADGAGVVGEAATVIGHADAAGELLVSAGARVLGRATSATRVVLGTGSGVQHAAAPVVCTTGGETMRAEGEIPSWDGSLDADLEWLLWTGVSIDRALRDLEAACGRALDGVGALLNVERRQAMPLQDLHAALRPTWLAAGRGWYVGAGTARVPGDLVLPAGTVVPMHLIVEGSIAAGPGVRFHGGIHAGRDVALGSGCIVDRSISAGGSISLGSACIVREVVHADGDFQAASGVAVGGPVHGGVAVMGSARLGAGVVIRNRVYSEGGASCHWSYGS